MEPQNLIAKALAQVCRVFDERDWRYCLIGGLAAAHWGEPRFTKDVDVVLLADIDDEPQIIADILSEFRPRIEDAAQFARLNRVLLVATDGGIPIDVSFGSLPFESQMLERTVRTTVLPGAEAPTATAEDVIVMKSIAGRPQDVKDIEGILASQCEALDLDYVRFWLGDLAELWVENDLLGTFDEIERTVRKRLRDRS